MSKNIEKKSFGSWFTTHPKKLMITILLIALPIFILALFASNYSRKNTRFHFSTNEDDIKYVYQSNISSKNKIKKYTDLNVSLKEISSYTTNDEYFKYGRFTFKISHVPTATYANSTFKFEGVLNASWFDDQLGDHKKDDKDDKKKNESRVESFSPNNSHNNPTEKTFYYPFNTPDRRLLLLKVGMPSLYLKITINYVPVNPDLPVSDDSETILYYKFDVNKSKDHDLNI